MTLALSLCRSADPVGRQFKILFLNCPTVDKAVDRSQQLFAKWRAGRPAGRQLSTLAPMALFWICFILWVLTAIFCFQVVKLTPNNLVSLINGIYPLPINRSHGSLILHKKNIQVSSAFKRRSVSLLFIFKVLSIAKFFCWFSSLINLYYWNFSLTLLLEPKIILHSIRSCKRVFVVFLDHQVTCIPLSCGSSCVEDSIIGVGYSGLV